MSFITFENVERIYHVGGNIIKAVDDVSFGIEKGTVNVVLGQSGAGKTTVLNLLGGMDSPTKGRIIADNQEISGMTEYELTTYRRNKIGFVFQFYNLVPNLTVLENVLLAEEICKDPLDAKEMLIKVGLRTVWTISQARYPEGSSREYLLQGLWQKTLRYYYATSLLGPLILQQGG